MGRKSNETVRRSKPISDWIFKINREVEIWKNITKDFFGKEDKNYCAIFGKITKFSKDIDRSLTNFKNNLVLITSREGPKRPKVAAKNGNWKFRQ